MEKKENFERIEKLLALLLIKQMESSSQKEKAEMLNLAGFSNTEIADLLNIKSTQVIANYLYSIKKNKKS